MITRCNEATTPTIIISKSDTQICAPPYQSTACPPNNYLPRVYRNMHTSKSLLVMYSLATQSTHYYASFLLILLFPSLLFSHPPLLITALIILFGHSASVYISYRRPMCRLKFATRSCQLLTVFHLSMHGAISPRRYTSFWHYLDIGKKYPQLLMCECSVARYFFKYCSQISLNDPR
jgi:hypothetical protein